MPLPFEVPDLERELRRLMEQIPAGKVATCGMLAQALGSPFAAKWVGHFALHHRHGESCPCHRIVRAGGELGGHCSGDLKAKIRRLKEEGVTIRQRMIDLDRYGFEAFASDHPLQKLREYQESLARKILLRPGGRVPKFVGGVDVAYLSSELGQAAYAMVETGIGGMVWSHVVQRPVRFPYISTFLSFRELPILLDLLDEVRMAGKLADVLMVDGSGVLHPRQAGAASHLGVAAEISTIGITKKLLCGKVDIENLEPMECRPILVEDCPTGMAIRPTAGSLRPIFISPGHWVDLSFAEEVTRQLLLGRRLPEPIYWADRLSKKRF